MPIKKLTIKQKCMSIDFSIIFSNLFASIGTQEELKAAAQELVNDVNNVYKARCAELAGKPAPKKESKKAEPKKKAESKKVEEAPLLTLADAAAIKRLNLTFVAYSDKAWVLRGDTKPIKEILKKEFNGFYNSRLKGGEGWIIKAADAPAVAKALGLKIKEGAA